MNTKEFYSDSGDEKKKNVQNLTLMVVVVIIVERTHFRS